MGAAVALLALGWRGRRRLRDLRDRARCGIRGIASSERREPLCGLLVLRLPLAAYR